ncbi:hypothetical protein SFB9_2660 [Klebsiella michiganensis]|nr:hypothetical protein SFB9_2660 [Klebsiella michiganensis]
MKKRDVIITKEQLTEWVSQLDSDGDCDATDHQLAALIRQSLVAMDSKPMLSVQFKNGWPVDNTTGIISGSPSLPDGFYDFYYTPQSVAAISSEQVTADCDPEVFEKGVSVCLIPIPKETAEVICKEITAATGCKVDWHYFGGRVHIKALPPSLLTASEREQVRREHAEWSQATFGNVGPVGPLKHLSKEALEAAADPSDLSEWADMQFLLWDAQRRMGISDELITRAMIEKLAINKTRQWPEPKDGEPRLHIKEQSGPESCAIADVIAERQRQQSVEGFSTEQDDTYVGCQLAAAAICYIEPMEAENYWPADWYDDSFKPTDTRRNLIKAAALIIAEIERIDRKSDAELTNE